MVPEVQTPGYSEFQRELFDATGLVFEVRADGRSIHLSLDGVRVLGLPLHFLNEPAVTVRRFEFPKNLRDGTTLAQRRAVLRALDEQVIVRTTIHDLLAGETGTDTQEQLAGIANLEAKVRDYVCTLIWDLDDLAVQRLANRLGV